MVKYFPWKISNKTNMFSLFILVFQLNKIKSFQEGFLRWGREGGEKESRERNRGRETTDCFRFSLKNWFFLFLPKQFFHENFYFSKKNPFFHWKSFWLALMKTVLVLKILQPKGHMQKTKCTRRLSGCVTVLSLLPLIKWKGQGWRSRGKDLFDCTTASPQNDLGEICLARY